MGYAIVDFILWGQVKPYLIWIKSFLGREIKYKTQLKRGGVLVIVDCSKEEAKGYASMAQSYGN